MRKSRLTVSRRRCACGRPSRLDEGHLRVELARAAIGLAEHRLHTGRQAGRGCTAGLVWRCGVMVAGGGTRTCRDGCAKRSSDPSVANAPSNPCGRRGRSTDTRRQMMVPRSPSTASRRPPAATTSSRGTASAGAGTPRTHPTPESSPNRGPPYWASPSSTARPSATTRAETSETWRVCSRCRSARMCHDAKIRASSSTNKPVRTLVKPAP